MRNFCLTLLLLNILAFAYQHWILGPDNRVAADYIDQDYQRLMLAAPAPTPAAELLSLRAPLDPDPLAVPESALLAYRCLRIGPFPQAADAEQIRAVLEGPDVVARRVSQEGQVWVGHWVQVTGQPDRASAEAARDALNAAGLPDAYIVPGAADFRVSLGVFRSLSSSRNSVNIATRLGFSTRITDRYQPGTTFWLLIRLPAARELGPGELRSDSDQILRVETLDCAQAEF